MRETEHYETAVEDRLPFMQKFAYGLGMLANNLQAAAIGALPIILNLGLAMDDMAVAPLVYQRAVAQGIGTELPL